jgi:signal transduction histidine kinase
MKDRTMTGIPLRARLFFGVSLVVTALYFVLPSDVANVVYDGLGVATIVVLFVGGATRPRGRRAAWYLLGAGMIGWVGGDVVWTAYELRNLETPYPGLADAIYLAAYPLWTVALLVLVRRRAGRAERTVLIDAAILTTAAGVLSWVYLIQPQVAGDKPVLTILVSLAYPLGDLLLLGVFARMVFGPGAASASYRLLVASVAITLVSDVAYATAMLNGTYEAMSWIDAGWVVSYGFWGAAALSPTSDSASERRQPRRDWGRMRLIPLAAAALVIPTLDLVQLARNESLAVELGTIAMVVLISARVALMFTRIESDAADLEAQSRSLRGALEDLRNAQAERTRLLDRTVRATEEERTRVAVELHDGPIQHLTALSFRLGKAKARLHAGDAGAAAESLAIAERELGDNVGELRRLMSDLRPPALDEGGLEAALRDQVDAFRRRSGADVGFEARLDHDLDPDTQVVLYRITQEALSNVGKHASAEHVHVRLATPNNHATLEVRDDGVGFDVARAPEFARQGHFGLAGMAQRASMIGGRFEVRSRPGAGTFVKVAVPVGSKR